LQRAAISFPMDALEINAKYEGREREGEKLTG
jgi:hypothetical protein